MKKTLFGGCGCEGDCSCNGSGGDCSGGNCGNDGDQAQQGGE